MHFWDLQAVTAMVTGLGRGHWWRTNWPTGPTVLQGSWCNRSPASRQHWAGPKGWAQEAGGRMDSLVLSAADLSENCPQLRCSCRADTCPQDMGPEQILHALFSQQNLSLPRKSVLRGLRPLLPCRYYYYWSFVAEQCCVSFGCIAKWFSYTYTYVYIYIYLPFQILSPFRLQRSIE